MLRGLVPMLEKHHKVRILDEAVVDAVRLSARYMPDRQLPDKAVSLLDTVCPRSGASQSATPPALDDTNRRTFSTSSPKLISSNARAASRRATPSVSRTCSRPQGGRGKPQSRWKNNSKRKRNWSPRFARSAKPSKRLARRPPKPTSSR